MAGYSLHRIAVVDIKEQVPIANKPSMIAIRNSVGCLEYVQTPFPSSSNMYTLYRSGRRAMVGNQQRRRTSSY